MGNGSRNLTPAYQRHYFYHVAVGKGVFGMVPLGNQTRIHLDGNMLAPNAKLVKQHGN
jgi:hypothetical protein